MRSCLCDVKLPFCGVFLMMLISICSFTPWYVPSDLTLVLELVQNLAIFPSL